VREIWLGPIGFTGAAPGCLGFFPRVVAGSLTVPPGGLTARPYAAPWPRVSNGLSLYVGTSIDAIQSSNSNCIYFPTRVRAITLLLEEEQLSAATLEAEAATTALQLAPTTTSSSSVLPPPSSRGDITVIAMLYVQACGVQNIHYLVSTVLDPASTGYVRWRDQVLLTLKRYKLVDYVLADTPPINDPAWDRMETVILSWIFDTITSEL
jgi:hypothetical protein